MLALCRFGQAKLDYSGLVIGSSLRNIMYVTSMSIKNIFVKNNGGGLKSYSCIADIVTVKNYALSSFIKLQKVNLASISSNFYELIFCTKNWRQKLKAKK